MVLTNLWKRLSPKQLNIAIQTFSLIAIFFEGYDQGVMGGVNASPKYVTEVGIGLPDGTVTKTMTQGGIVSIVSNPPRINHIRSHSLGCIMYSLSNFSVLSWSYRRLFRGRL